MMHWHMSLSTAAMRTRSTRGSAAVRAGGGRDRVVGFEVDHRPRDQAERLGRALRHLELTEQSRVDIVTGLVAGEQLVPERLDHVIECDATVRDRSGTQDERERAQEDARRPDLDAIVLCGRRTEPRAK